jgi:hypothetical protein
MDKLEATVGFQLNVCLFLLEVDEEQIRAAIITTRKYSDTLLTQIEAVRQLEDEA